MKRRYPRPRPTTQAVEGGRGRYGGNAVVLALLLSVGSSVRVSALQCPDGSPPPCRAQPARATTAPAPSSVAVLYFDNLSRDTSDAYLADGLTEEIIDQLAAVERLRVKSRHAVRRYRGRELGDLSALGRSLGVRYLVDGRFRRAGSRMRLSVRLVRTEDALQVWSASYDRAAQDLLALQEEIATQVATSIAGRLLPAERASLAAQPTHDPQAYDHFLRGNHYLARRSPRSVLRAIEEYEAAVRLDRAFTQALARIAVGYAIILAWRWPLPGLSAESALARGLGMAERVIRESPNLSEGWVARANLLAERYPRTFEGVREAYDRAIALDPRDAESHHQYGVRLMYMGHDSAAADVCRRALAIEPERAVTLVAVGVLHYYGRHREAARQWLDSALALDPGFHLGYAYRARLRLELGERAEARRDAETSARLGRDDPVTGGAILALTAARAGDTVGARSSLEPVLADLRRTQRPGDRRAAFAAAALVATGDTEGALDLLQRAEPRGARLWFELRAPEFDPVREDPRFRRLLEEAGPR